MTKLLNAWISLLLALALLAGCAQATPQPLLFGLAPWPDGEQSTYTLTDRSGQQIGSARYTLTSVPATNGNDDEGAWQLVRTITALDSREAMTITMDARGFRPQASQLERVNAAGRETVVFGTAHALTRSASPAGAVLTTADSAVNFRLAGASAFFRRDFDHGVEAAKVDNGTLSVDFSRSTFATQLGVSSPTLGVDNVLASGTIGKDGVMRSTSANAIVQGATTLDGKEAGYLFEKNLATGALRGVTLWGR